MTDIHSNDTLSIRSAPATLATVTHGGCVQLGDGLPPLPKMQRFTNLYGETFAYSAEQMRDYARSALSAQPSPGGQGDALQILANYLCVPACDLDMEDEISLRGAMEAIDLALDARQPVGEEPITVEAVATIFDHPEYGLSINWLLENGIGELQVGDVLMVSDRAITDEDGSGEVYAAPPAQAVDLGAIIEQVAKQWDGCQYDAVGETIDVGRAIRAAGKRLIDSQAVGN